MCVKRYILLFLYFIIFHTLLFSSNEKPNTTITNKPQEKYSDETIKFWEKTLKYGTSAQKRSVLYAIKGERVLKAIPIIVKYLPTEKNLFIKKEMISTLVALSNKSAAPYLMEMLKEPNISEEMQEFAISSIGMIKYREAGKYILKYLDSRNIQVKEAALRALGEIEYKESVPIIIDRLKKEENERVRTQMILTLANIKSEKSQKILISIFTNESEKMINRKFAATGLGYIRNELSFKILSQYIEKVNSELKARITEALGNLNNKKAVNILIECLKDDDKAVRYYAIKSLEKLRAKEAIEILEYKKEYDLESKVRKAAEEALNQIKGEKKCERN